jgi:hypothetical protein
VRPERPGKDEAPELNDDIWELAERCWVKEPNLRPTAEGVSQTISHFLETRNAASVTATSAADADNLRSNVNRPQRPSHIYPHQIPPPLEPLSCPSAGNACTFSD